MMKNEHMGREGVYKSEPFLYEHGMCVFIGSIGTYEHSKRDPPMGSQVCKHLAKPVKVELEGRFIQVDIHIRRISRMEMQKEEEEGI